MKIIVAVKQVPVREALAKGADRAIHIPREGLVRFDTLALARRLAAAAAAERADLSSLVCSRTISVSDRPES